MYLQGALVGEPMQCVFWGWNICDIQVLSFLYGVDEVQYYIHLSLAA